MLKSPTRVVVGLASVMMIAPGVVQSSFARSALEQRKENAAFQALAGSDAIDPGGVLVPPSKAYARRPPVAEAAPATPPEVKPYREQREY